jgi:hypothetical protein
MQANATARQKIFSWRIALLRDAGFTQEIAERVARDRGYDLHALLDLVDRGCPPQHAVRILAPLDEDGVSPC